MKRDVAVLEAEDLMLEHEEVTTKSVLDDAVGDHRVSDDHIARLALRLEAVRTRRRQLREIADLTALDLVIADAESDPRTPFDTLVRLWTERGTILNAQILDEASVYGPPRSGGFSADVHWSGSGLGLYPGRPASSRHENITCAGCRLRATRKP